MGGVVVGLLRVLNLATSRAEKRRARWAEVTRVGLSVRRNGGCELVQIKSPTASSVGGLSGLFLTCVDQEVGFRGHGAI